MKIVTFKYPSNRLMAALATLVLSASLPTLPAVAETPGERGLAIAQKADHRDVGFGDTKATMTMTLTS